jgi:hypothetical protein
MQRHTVQRFHRIARGKALESSGELAPRLTIKVNATLNIDVH